MYLPGYQGPYSLTYFDDQDEQVRKKTKKDDKLFGEIRRKREATGAGQGLHNDFNMRETMTQTFDRSSRPVGN